ncbi:MAG: CAP domain-containing protein [Planctomycetota bacterium]|nr:CAP domain-containing protein [Planctomycetota bacterium]
MLGPLTPLLLLLPAGGPPLSGGAMEAPRTIAAARQDVPDERALIKAAMATLRARRVTDDEREEAIEALLGLGAEGPRLLAQHAAKACKAAAKDNAKRIDATLSAFDKGAAAVLKVRLGRKARAEVDEHRAVILAGARDKSLTKESIKATSDPALARLQELLTVRPAQVWERDEELFERWDACLAGLDAEARWFRTFGRARDALEASGPKGPRQASRLKAPPAPARGAEAALELLELRAWLATPMGEADQRVFAANRELAGTIDAEELAGVFEHNRRRVLIGLGAQRIDVKLCEAGRGHSKDMEERGFFSHTSPVKGKESFGQRAALAGTSANAENIAMGQRSGRDAVLGWWYSPGHHRNMLGGQSRIGLGRHGVHWTELFG